MADHEIYEEINNLLREKYLLHHIKQDFSEMDDGNLVFVYTRLLCVYDDVNKPECYSADRQFHYEPTSDNLKHILRCLRSLGLSFLVTKPKDLLNKKKATRIIFAIHDKVISKYDKNISQRVRLIIKREQLTSKAVPNRTKNLKDEPSQESVENTFSDNEALLGETLLPTEYICAPSLKRIIPGGWQIPRTPMKSTSSTPAGKFLLPPPAFMNSPIAELAEGQSLKDASAFVLTPPSEFCDSSSELSSDSGCAETPILDSDSRRRTYVVNSLSPSDDTSDNSTNSEYSPENMPSLACMNKQHKYTESSIKRRTYCIPKVSDILEENHNDVESDEETYNEAFKGENRGTSVISKSFGDDLRRKMYPVEPVSRQDDTSGDSNNVSPVENFSLDMCKDKRRTYCINSSPSKNVKALNKRETHCVSKVSDILGEQSGAEADNRQHFDSKNKRRTYILRASTENIVDLKNMTIPDRLKLEENEPELENLNANIERENLKNGGTYGATSPRRSKMNAEALINLNTTGFDPEASTKKLLFVDLLKSDISFAECGKGHIPRGRELTRTPPSFNASSFIELESSLGGTLCDYSIVNVSVATQATDVTYMCTNVKSCKDPDSLVMNVNGSEKRSRTSVCESLANRSKLSDIVSKNYVSELTSNIALDRKFNFDDSLDLFPIRDKEEHLIRSISTKIDTSDHESKMEKPIEQEIEICDALDQEQNKKAEKRLVNEVMCKTRKEDTKQAQININKIKIFEVKKEMTKKKIHGNSKHTSSKEGEKAKVLKDYKEAECIALITKAHNVHPEMNVDFPYIQHNSEADKLSEHVNSEADKLSKHVTGDIVVEGEEKEVEVKRKKRTKKNNIETVQKNGEIKLESKNIVNKHLEVKDNMVEMNCGGAADNEIVKRRKRTVAKVKINDQELEEKDIKNADIRNDNDEGKRRTKLATAKSVVNKKVSSNVQKVNSLAERLHKEEEKVLKVYSDAKENQKIVPRSQRTRVKARAHDTDAKTQQEHKNEKKTKNLNGKDEEISVAKKKNTRTVLKSIVQQEAFPLLLETHHPEEMDKTEICTINSNSHEDITNETNLKSQKNSEKQLKGNTKLNKNGLKDEEIKPKPNSRGRKRAAVEENVNGFIEEDKMVDIEAIRVATQEDISPVIEEVEFKKPDRVGIRRIPSLAKNKSSSVKCKSSSGNVTTLDENTQAICISTETQNAGNVRTKSKPSILEENLNKAGDSALERAHSVRRKNKNLLKTELDGENYIEKNIKTVNQKPSQHDQQREEMKSREDKNISSISKKESESETAKKNVNSRGRPRLSRVSALIEKFNKVGKENVDASKQTGPKKRINKKTLQEKEKFHDPSSEPSKATLPLTESNVRPSRKCKVFAINAITEMLNETD